MLLINTLTEMLRKERGNTLTVCLSVMAVAGVVLFISFLAPRSDAETQFLFGLSRTRLVIASVFLVLVLANLGIAVFSITNPRWLWEFLEDKLSKADPGEVGAIGVWLYVLVFLTGTFLLLIIPPVPVSFRFLEAVRARSLDLMIWLFMLSLLSVVLLRILVAAELRYRPVFSILDQVLFAGCVLLFIFFVYEHFAAWIGWVGKIKFSYWNLLAKEFLSGNLYLVDPPSTRDLTLYQGRWYVPNPPLPAILLMPLAYLIDPVYISTSDFSMFFSAVNSVLMFLILDQLARRQWIRLSRTGILCLVALFAFGTPHLWVGISGRMWFVSQILTVTCLGLATLASLKSWSPWIIGICIGMAIAARPNGLMTWFFVFAIAIQIMKDQYGRVDFRQMTDWSVKSLIPIGISVAGLLLYNHARFDDYLDFGYISINGDPDIVENARTYGLFSPHYISYNLRVMFLYLPRMNWGNQWPLLPSGAGMSLFLTTPPLIYLFRRYEIKWWTLGAWLTVLFNFILLVLYHNTGRDQFGYRYILDAMVPLIALLGAALGNKIPWHFIILVILSIAINLYGANWFMNG